MVCQIGYSRLSHSHPAAAPFVCRNRRKSGVFAYGRGARFPSHGTVRAYGYEEDDLAAAPPAPPADFAEPPSGPAVDALAAETAALETAAAPDLAACLADLGTRVDSAPDLASLQSALLAAYGGLDTDRLTRLMAAAFALAELKGLADVAEGQ